MLLVITVQHSTTHRPRQRRRDDGRVLLRVDLRGEARLGGVLVHAAHPHPTEYHVLGQFVERRVDIGSLLGAFFGWGKMLGNIRTVNADAVLEILRPVGAEAGSAALQPTHDQGHQRQGSGQGNQESDRHDG